MPRICALVALFTLTPAALAEDWPQWLGPRRDGSTVEKVQPWKGDLKVLWREPVPEGHSSPVVVGKRVFLHSCQPGMDIEVIDCYQADSGRLIWRYEYPRGPFKGLFGRGPRATPARGGSAAAGQSNSA